MKNVKNIEILERERERERESYNLKDNKKGITLIALILTIIIMLILVSVTISITIGDGIFSEAGNAVLATKLSAYQEQVEIYKYTKKLENINFTEESLTAGENSLIYDTQEEGKTGTIYDIIPDLKGSNFDKRIEIVKGKLILNTTSKREIKVAKKLGIEPNPYDIEEGGKLKPSKNNLLLMDETGTLTIPASVTEIGEGAFSNLSGLKTIIIPGTCKKIGKNAFANNETLEKVIMKDGVTEIGESAFNGCRNLQTVDMPNSITILGDSAFSGCINLKDVKLSESLTNIPGYIFYACKNLKEIEIPNGVTLIDVAFTGCSNLESITIPKTVISITAGAFNNCNKLSNIKIHEDNTNFKFQNGILLGNGGKEMILILDSAITGSTFTVPSGVTTLVGGQLSKFPRNNDNKNTIKCYKHRSWFY